MLVLFVFLIFLNKENNYLFACPGGTLRDKNLLLLFQEDPPKEKTPVVYNTNNPEYNFTFPLTINRNSRACQRVFKRHSIKCEVWSKGYVYKKSEEKFFYFFVVNLVIKLLITINFFFW